MPRHARSARAGVIYHVLNRAAEGAKLFSKTEDYQAFEQVLMEAHKRVPIRMLAYCVLPTQWHLLLWPKTGQQLAEFMRWLTVTHTQRWHWARKATAGRLYQSRYRSFPVEPGRPTQDLIRFIESSPVRLRLARKAEDWRWSSLARRRGGDPEELLTSPSLRFPPNWLAQVNRPADDGAVQLAETSITRSRPYGTPEWVARTVKQMGLEWTIRPRGRPRKAQTAAKSAKTGKKKKARRK